MRIFTKYQHLNMLYFINFPFFHLLKKLMSYLNSIIQFTFIGMQKGLPIDVIKLILSFHNPTQTMSCDFCKDFFSTMWYKRKCIECNINNICCCNICWKNDIIMDSGQYCSRCLVWFCGLCCNKLAENDENITDQRFGNIKCPCGNYVLSFNNYQLPFISYDPNDDPGTKRTI